MIGVQVVILVFNLKTHHLKPCLGVFFVISLVALLAINCFNPIACGECVDAYLFITPPMYIAREIGELFDVAINVSSVENLRSVGFTVTYNTSLLDVAQVVQGPFFPAPPKSSFKFEKNESAGFIKINMSLVDSETSRSGNGTLAWISFEVVQAPESCVSSPLDLKQTLLLNSALNSIAHDSVGAVYFWRSLQPDPPAEGRLLDVYTQKAGGGIDQPGGEFVTGEIVYLVCRVTYGNDPVQNKLVSFEVQTPFNESVVILTVITDQEGYAVIVFRIPQIPSSNGTWSAISVVRIAEEIVWDTISFQVIYLEIPVGGYTLPTEEHATEKLSASYLALVAISIIGFIVVRCKTYRRTKRSPIS